MDAPEAFAWWETALEGGDGVRCLRVGDRAALFCERGQQLFELNPTAEIIWSALAAGRTPRAVAGELEALGAPAAEARAFVAQSAGAWVRAGQLAPAGLAERLRSPAAWTLDLRVGEAAFTLRAWGGAAAALGPELEAVFGQFRAEADPASAAIDIAPEAGGYGLRVGGTFRGVFAGQRIVPDVKAALTEALAAGGRPGTFLLHAALLTRGGRGLLICGAPGAGKTTLAAALAARGLGYGSDDIVSVADGGFHGVAFAPACKAGAWPLLAGRLPGLGERPVHERADGQAVRYLPVAGFAAGEATSLGWVLQLDRRAEAPPHLAPVEPLAMVTELLVAAFAADHRLDGAALQALAAAVSGADCRRLTYSDLEAAADAVAAWIDG